MEKDIKSFGANKKGYRRRICSACAQRLRREKDPDRFRATDGREKRKLWAETVEAYGGSCACCGEPEAEFLTIDHIKDDGNEHRIVMRPTAPKTWAGSTLYRWLRKNGWPEGFQLLCANCNMAKARKGGCPHERQRTANSLD